MHEPTDVAIVGAGPYGLALSSHLAKRGIDHRVVGVPMLAWKQMSPGMFLKSFAWATTVPTAPSKITLPDYCRKHQIDPGEPVSMASFADYGSVVQQTYVRDILSTDVTSLRGTKPRFELILGDGESLLARRVVLATGLSHFEHVPEVLSALTCDKVTHTAHISDFQRFRGMRVAIVGRGQSALQAATLLSECGADPVLLARSGIEWHDRMADRRSFREVLRRPPSGMGPGRRNWVLENVPMLMHYLPESRRVRFTREHLGPCGAWWLRDRFEGRVETLTGVSVADAGTCHGKISLRLHNERADPSTLLVDHVITGTGYDVDVDRVRFIDCAVRSKITRVERAPRLSRHFESSVPGLYFIGPSSAPSFGPLFRFVLGASYAVDTVARHLASTALTSPAWRRPFASV